METILPSPRLVAVLALSLILSACAAHKPTQSGFLNDAPATVPAAAYTAALIDLVEYRPTGRTSKSPRPKDIAALTEAYQAELAGAFAARYALADKPGPGVLRVRAAVTGYTLASPGWNGASLALPIGPRNGGISTEAEVVDSQTGARLTAQTMAFNGHVWNAKPTDMFDRDGHARTGFRKHARALAEATP
jgi:hypothetical protein